MDVSFSLTTKDYLLSRKLMERRCRHLLDPNGSLRLLLWAAGLFLAIGFVGLVDVIIRYGGPEQKYLGIAIGGIAVALLLFNMHQKVLQAKYSKWLISEVGPFPLQERLAITDKGLFFEGHTGNTLWAWSATVKIEEIDNYVAIWGIRAGAVLIPKSEFANDNERQRFIQAVEDHIPRK